jgi:hypothetical protein
MSAIRQHKIVGSQGFNSVSSQNSSPQEHGMATELTPSQMKEFVPQHFEDFVNNQNAAVIRKNMTPDFYDHDGPGGKPTGLAGDEQMMVGMYTAMPDLRVTIE